MFPSKSYILDNSEPINNMHIEKSPVLLGVRIKLVQKVADMSATIRFVLTPSLRWVLGVFLVVGFEFLRHQKKTKRTMNKTKFKSRQKCWFKDALNSNKYAMLFYFFMRLTPLLHVIAILFGIKITSLLPFSRIINIQITFFVDCCFRIAERMFTLALL